MKSELIAIPVFQDRVSPLMDVSNMYMIYKTEDGKIKQSINISLNANDESQRVEKLKEIGVNTIICGAVSDYVTQIIDKNGIRLLSMIYGPIDEIIEHYLNNSLGSYCSEAGGCNGRNRERRGQCDRGARVKRQNKIREEG